MNNLSSFERLSNALSPEERRDLFQKIKNSLSIQDDQEKDTLSMRSDATVRQHQIQKEMERVGIFTRFKIWLLSVFSSKSREAVFLEIKLQKVRQSLYRKKQWVLEPSGKTLSPDIAKRVHGLYLSVFPLIGLFQRLFYQDKSMEELVSFLLEQRIPNAKKRLEDFLPLSEIKSIYFEKESKKEIVVLFNERLKNYLNSIPPKVFILLEEHLAPLYVIKNLVLFPYGIFFEAFKYDLPEGPPEETANFKLAKTEDVIVWLEKLYTALYSVSRNSRQSALNPAILEFCSLRFSEGGPDSSTGVTTDLSGYFEHVHDKAVEIARHIPFTDIIRLFQQDPYYKILVYMPTLKLRDFYHALLRMKILEEIDASFQMIRNSVIDDALIRLFSGKTMETFEYYRKEAPTAAQKLGLPGFMHEKSLRVVLTFIKKNYYERLRDVVSVITKTIPFKDRDFLSTLNLNAAGIEDCYQMIKSYDYSFSPESEEGKNYFRLLNSVEKELGQHKIYKSFVMQKDKESRALIEKSIEHLMAVRNLFGEVLKLHKNAIKERKIIISPKSTETASLETVMRASMDQIQELAKIARHISAMEQGN